MGAHKHNMRTYHGQPTRSYLRYVNSRWCHLRWCCLTACARGTARRHSTTDSTARRHSTTAKHNDTADGTARRLDSKFYGTAQHMAMTAWHNSTTAWHSMMAQCLTARQGMTRDGTARQDGMARQYGTTAPYDGMTRQHSGMTAQKHECMLDGIHDQG